MLRNLVLAALFCAATTSADAAVFMFSFSNENGTDAGDVSGTITLPDGDGTSIRATSFQLDTYPAALNLPQAPISSQIFSSANNSFTVSAGQITDADFVRAVADGTYLFLSSAFVDGATGLGCLCSEMQGVFDSDSSTLSFASPTVVPLPAGLPLLASGLFGLAGLGLLRRRAA